MQTAVQELRSRLSLTQSELAQRTGRTLGTIQRYEGLGPPKGEALASLASIALESGYEDIAQVFAAALLKEIGPDMVKVILWSEGKGGLHLKETTVIPRGMYPLVEWFVQLFGSKGTAEHEALKQSLKSMAVQWARSKDKKP